jgi:hypothetical protein
MVTRKERYTRKPGEKAMAMRRIITGRTSVCPREKLITMFGRLKGCYQAFLMNFGVSEANYCEHDNLGSVSICSK